MSTIIQSLIVDPQTGQRTDHYYPQESVGIAAGILVSALIGGHLFMEGLV